MANSTVACPHHHSLCAKHAELEREIEAELNRPKPDDLILQDLKRRKLRLKDKIEDHFYEPVRELEAA